MNETMNKRMNYFQKMAAVDLESAEVFSIELLQPLMKVF